MDRHDTKLERFEHEFTLRLMTEYERLLRQRKQFHVLGVIEFLEEEIFPQYPDYRATLEKLVQDHSKKEGLVFDICCSYTTYYGKLCVAYCDATLA